MNLLFVSCQNRNDYYIMSFVKNRTVTEKELACSSAYTSMSAFNFSGRPTIVQQVTSLMSMADYLDIYNTSHIESFEDLPYLKVLIKVKSGKSKAEALRILNKYAVDLKYNVFDYDIVVSSFRTVNLILNVLFGFIVGVCMVLSLFSLISTMSSNMLEQKKELAVMRCIGLRRLQIVRIYMYEAIAVILTGAAIGLLVGCMVGWTIVAQNTLFSNQTFSLVFPWTLIGVVFVTSIISSLLAAGIPAFNMLQQNIVSLIKSIN